MAVPNPLIQYSNKNPFSPIRGTKFVMQTPQMQPRGLVHTKRVKGRTVAPRGVLPCSTCVEPKFGIISTTCGSTELEVPDTLYIRLNRYVFPTPLSPGTYTGLAPSIGDVFELPWINSITYSTGSFGSGKPGNVIGQVGWQSAVIQYSYRFDFDSGGDIQKTDTVAFCAVPCFPYLLSGAGVGTTSVCFEAGGLTNLPAQSTCSAEKAILSSPPLSGGWNSLDTLFTIVAATPMSGFQFSYLAGFEFEVFV